LYFAPSTISAQYILSFIFLLISKVALESLANFENSGIPGFSAQTFPLKLFLSNFSSLTAGDAATGICGKTK
jgi:hypothetical protein